MVEKFSDLGPLANHGVRITAVAGEFCETLHGRVALRFHQVQVANQGDAIDLPVLISVSVIPSAIRCTHQAVVTNETGHDEGMQRPI